MEKSNGPRTELWGTPYLRDRTSDVDAFTCTVCFLSVRNDTQVWLAVYGLSPETLTQVSPETIHTLPVFEGGDHGCTSKAVAKSTKIAPQNLLSFIRESHWSTRLAKAVWREWFSLNPDWLEWSRLFLLKCARMCFIYVFLKRLWESWQDRNCPIIWRIWTLSRLKKRNDFGLFGSGRNVTVLYTQIVNIR